MKLSHYKYFEVALVTIPNKTMLEENFIPASQWWFIPYKPKTNTRRDGLTRKKEKEAKQIMKFIKTYTNKL